MKNNQIKLILLVVLIILIGSIFFVYPKYSHDNGSNNKNPETINESEQKILTLRHQFKDGEHTFVGQLDVPTPCHTVLARVLPSNKSLIEITTKSKEEVCAQTVTNKSFGVKFEGEKDTVFSATLNGQPIEINIIDISLDKDIYDPVFIKG